MNLMTFNLKFLSQRSMEFNDLLDLKQNLHFYYLFEVLFEQKDLEIYKLYCFRN